MKTQLPVTLGESFKKVLEDNFKEIEKFMKTYKGEGIEKKLTTLHKNFYDQIQKEIRAIVMPEMSPLEVTEQVQKSKTDLKGNKHKTLSERIAADFQNLNTENENKNDNTDIVVTENGTLVYDFTSKSKIQKVKTIACLGDSVALGSHAKKNYGKMLAEKLGAKVTNYAILSATMAKISSNTNSIYEQALKVKNTDLIILQGTDDDWLNNRFNGIDIGTDKTNVNTFYGAFYQAVKTLKAHNKNAKIIVLTATRQLPVRDGVIRRKDTDKNKKGLTLEKYVNAQVLACSELNIPVIDAYHLPLTDPYNPAFRVKNMQDGLHPNELAHEVIMYEIIKNFYYFYG